MLSIDILGYIFELNAYLIFYGEGQLQLGAT